MGPREALAVVLASLAEVPELLLEDKLSRVLLLIGESFVSHVRLKLACKRHLSTGGREV